VDKTVSGYSTTAVSSFSLVTATLSQANEIAFAAATFGVYTYVYNFGPGWTQTTYGYGLYKIVSSTSPVTFSSSWAPAVTGTDNWPAIQGAINYALQNNFASVCLSDGTYLTSDTLQLGYGQQYVSISLTSCGNSRSPGVGLPAITILPSHTDRCAINIQGGRNVGISGIGVQGFNNSWASNIGSAAPSPP